MSKNVFQQLEQEMEGHFEKSSHAIKSNIKGQKNFWTIVGDLFNLYIPNFINTIIGTPTTSASNGISNDDTQHS